jgi:hypothetical protein
MNEAPSFKEEKTRAILEAKKKAREHDSYKKIWRQLSPSN